MPSYDLDAIAVQRTARGRFVRRLQEQIEHEATDEERAKLELALLTGLRALDGRKELVQQCG